MRRFILTITVSLGLFSAYAQDHLPYYEIQEYSEEFTAGSVAARMVDALGFRFYWATDSLTFADLNYRANEKGRSTEETIKHIYNLSKTIVNSTLNTPNTRTEEELNFQHCREQTLTNLKTAADILRKSDDISKFKIIFGSQEFPFWNQINGPIADAIWHCGQIANNRRSSGNPISPKVNHFLGKLRD